MTVRFLPSLLWILAPIGVVSPGAKAQVWPAAYASTPGNAVLNTPFTSPPGHPTAMTRMMVVIAPGSLPFSAPVTLTRLSLRRDTRYPNQGYGSASGTLTVKLGRAAMLPDQVQDVRFDRLWEGAPTTVYSNSAPFAVPSAAAPGTSVPPFSIVINFTRSYTWQGGPLAIEFQFTPSSGTTAWRVDGFALPAPMNGTFRSRGAGCAGRNGYRPYHYALPETPRPGAILTTQVEGVQSTQPFAIHLLGFQSLVPPVDLGVIGVGPAGCLLRITPVLQFPVPTYNPSSGFQRAISQVQLPAQPAAVGTLLYSQWLSFDSGVSGTLPIVLSDALEITLGQVLPPPALKSARTIWKYGATGYGNDSGQMVLDDYAPILRFN
jgi:hypothetical protein